MFEQYKDVVTVPDLMSMLRIGKNIAYSLLKNGTIASVRIGKKYIIPKKSIISYLNSAINLNERC